MDSSLEIFDKEDFLLYTSNFLETGIKQGFKFIHRKDIVIESDCNSLCMTVSMLNYGLIGKDLKKLNMLEKLYLFFLSYLQTRDYNIKDSDRLDFEHALRKADMIFLFTNKRSFRKQSKKMIYKIVVEQDNTKRMLKSLKKEDKC